MKYIFVCVLLFGSMSTGIAQNKRICVMGSSTAWGYFTIDGTLLYPRDSAWAFKLKKHYKDLNVIDTLFNIAANSSSCYDGMPSSYVAPPGRNQPYVGFNITKAVRLSPKPDVIIVNYPTNQYDYLSKEEILFCLQTIKDSANASGIRCFITTTQPRDNFSESERQKLKELRDLIIQRFGPYAIDFWTDVTVPVNLMNPLYNLGDKIHLTPTAHTLLKNRAVNANIFFIALPVNFQQFNAQKKTASVALQWSTSSEINSHHFDIEKSMDGVKFTHLATVAASGNSSQLLNYTAEDAHPFTGSNYYRIVSVDNNQQKTFSNKLSVSFNKTGFSVSEVYSNPVANMLSFQLESDKKEMVEIIVFSTDGRKVSEENVVLNKTMLFKKDVSKLPSGRYTIRIETATEKITRPFIKQ